MCRALVAAAAAAEHLIPRYACDAEMCRPAAWQIQRLKNGGRGRVEEDNNDKGLDKADEGRDGMLLY